MQVLILNAHPSAALGASLQQILASKCIAHIDHLKQPIVRIDSLSEFDDSIAERVKAACIALLLTHCLSGFSLGTMVSSLIVAE